MNGSVQKLQFEVWDKSNKGSYEATHVELKGHYVPLVKPRQHNSIASPRWQ